jgi:DNA-binding CsgD family transcriptional regulator
MNESKLRSALRFHAIPEIWGLASRASHGILRGVSQQRIFAEARTAMNRVAHAGHGLPELFDHASRVLRKAIPFDAACWHTLDPATLLETSHYVENLPFENPRASELEYLYDDFNQFATLANAPQRSGILSEATGGEPERSRRYRELIRPFGLGAELRAAFVTQAAGWGAVGLLRPPSSPDFTLMEAALLDDVSSSLAQGVRTAFLQAEARKADPSADAPGLVLLDHRLRLEAITPAAEPLLAELAETEGGGPSELPYVVYAVAARAQAAGRSDSSLAMARARVLAKSGRWLALHGALAQGKPPGHAAVIIEPAKPALLAPLLVQAYGVTGREEQVLRHLLRGASTKDISALLGISPYTVQEHLKKLFDKFGVRSRRQLVGRVFFEQYAAKRRD